MGSYKKKLFIVLLLILLLSFFVCGSANAQGMDDIQYTIEQANLLKTQQEYLASVFLRKLISQKPNTDNLLTNFYNYASSPNYYSYFVYSINNNNAYISCYFIPININYNDFVSDTINTNDAYFEDVYLLYPVSGYNLTANNWRRFRYRVDNQASSYESYSNNLFIPSCLIMYQNNVVINFINGIYPSSSSIALILNAINENTEQQAETTEEMKKLNDFMSSEDVDEDAYNMPTDNPTQDITQDGINSIFDRFYNTIDNWSANNIEVHIPFTNKAFLINANTTEVALTHFSNNSFAQLLKTLLNLVWYYVLARYIIKDIQKYIDGLKTGEILTKSDTNVKTEML